MFLRRTSMRYRTKYEKDIAKGIFFLIIGLISISTILMELYYDSEISDSVSSVAILLSIGIMMFLRSFIPIKRRQLFEEKGKRYSGKIMYAESTIGKDRSYYLLIEFRANGKRMVRRSGAYADNPNKILYSRDCSVYEYKGKYLEGDFQTRHAPCYGNNFIRVDYNGSSARKKKNYV